jgi:hypothetical protein
MVTSISANPGVNLTALHGQGPAGPGQTGKSVETPQDTVKISAKALAAAGNAAHDDDKH